MLIYCPKCSRQISDASFCQSCGPLQKSPAAGVPGLRVPDQPPIVYAALRPGNQTPEQKILNRKRYRRAYRIPFIAAIFYFVMCIYLLSDPESNQLVRNPWPFIFACSYYLSFFSYIVALFMRKQAPMLFFIWSVTVSIFTVLIAVGSIYGLEGVSLSQYIWALIGLVVVASFWSLKYSLHHKVKNF